MALFRISADVGLPAVGEAALNVLLFDEEFSSFMVHRRELTIAFRAAVGREVMVGALHLLGCPGQPYLLHIAPTLGSRLSKRDILFTSLSNVKHLKQHLAKTLMAVISNDMIVRSLFMMSKVQLKAVHLAQKHML